MLDLIPIAAVRASVVLNYSWCGVRLDHRRREVGLTNDYPRLDESLSVLVERFPSLQPLAGAEFLNNGTLCPSMKAANKTRQDNNVIRTQGKTKLLTGKICDRQTDGHTSD